MAGRKVVLQVGLLPIPVRLEKATNDEGSATKTVCVGTAKAPHPAAKVNSKYECGRDGCDRTASSYHPFERGVPQDDGTFVVLTSEELAGANAPVKDMALAFRSREKVFATTVAGQTVNNVIPDRGGEKGYTALRDALLARPDVVAVTVWAHTTKNHLWVLEVVDGRLVASQRAWPEDVRPAPAVMPADITEAEAAMFGQLVDASMADFDPLTFRDVARERREALIAQRTGQDVSGGPVLPSTTPGGTDMLAALQASLASVPTDRKEEPKKAAKKTAAKRTTKRAKKVAAPPSEPAA